MALVACLLLHPFIAAGQYKISGTIAAYPGQNLTLLKYFGDKHEFADSLTTGAGGSFVFTLGNDTPSGLYSIAFGNKPVFNLIFNKEDISLKFDASTDALPEIIFSAENMIYYDYLLKSDRFMQKTALLTDVLRYYPEPDTYYESSRDHFNRLQREFLDYTGHIIQDYPGSLVAKMIKSDRPLTFPEDFNWEAYGQYLRSNFLNGIDFTDTILINTNIVTGKAIDYLGLYTASQAGKEVQEKLFIQAVDTILHKAMDNGVIYDFLMQYLIEGFEMYGFDRLIGHIAENYEPANTCVNEDRKSELQKRVENLRRLAVGMQAPEIEITNSSGESFSIAAAGHRYLLVLFWASWCPHCNAMIPELADVYKATPLDLEVLAISLDTSASDYDHAISTHSAGWIDHCDLKGWDSKPAADYSIYATPTMFLLDQKRTIIARPASVYELKAALKKLL